MFRFEDGIITEVEITGMDVPAIRTFLGNSADKLISTIQPIPGKDWPLWAKALAMISKPEDKGIGDIVARTIGAENSEAFRKWFKATTGKDCGCTGRHRRLNIEYPLP